MRALQPYTPTRSNSHKIGAYEINAGTALKPAGLGNKGPTLTDSHDPSRDLGSGSPAVC